MSTAETKIILSAKDQFTKVLNSLQKELKEVQKVAGGVARDGFDKIAGAGKAAATGLMVGIPLLGAAIGGLGVNAVLTAGKYETLNAALETSLGSTAAAKTAFAQIQDFAAKTPFQLEEVTGAFVKLKNMGLNNSERALRSYGDTASAMGKSLNDMVEAVADAATGEFERLKEFGIRASSQGDKVTFTFKGVSTTVKKESKAIEGYLIGLGETNFAGGMEKQSQTLQGKLSTLKDTFDITMAAFANDTGLSDWAKKGVDAADKYLAAVKPLFDLLRNGEVSADAGEALNKAFGWTKDSKIVRNILNVRGAVLDLYDILSTGELISGDGLLALLGSSEKVDQFSDAIVKVTEQFNILNKDGELVKAMFVGLGGVIATVVLAALWSMAVAVIAATWPFVALGAAIGTLYYVWSTNMWGIQGIMKQLWAIVQPILIQIWGIILTQLVPSFRQMWASMMELYNLIQPFIIPTLKVLGAIIGVFLVAQILVSLAVWNFLFKTIGAGVRFISDQIRAFINFWQGISKIFSSIVKGDWSGAWEGFKQVAGSVIDSVVSKVRFLTDTVRGAMDSVKNFAANAQNIASNFKIPGRAVGGVVREPMTLVGERGPELVSLPQGSRVHTATQSRAMMNEGSGSGAVNINVGGVTIGSYMGTEKDKRNMADELAEAIAAALKKRKLI